MESGFGEEDDYAIYSKPLFVDRVEASIYNIKEVASDDDGNDDGNNSIQKTDKSSKPVDFEEAWGADVISTKAGLFHPEAKW